MQRTLDRRSAGIALAVVLLVVASGCSAVVGGDGSSGGQCGPGETNISAVAETNSTAPQTVSFTGEVVVTSHPESRPEHVGASYVISDGTATAYVAVPSNDVSEGDCLTVEGTAHAFPTNDSADVLISPSDVSQA